MKHGKTGKIMTDVLPSIRRPKRFLSLAQMEIYEVNIPFPWLDSNSATRQYSQRKFASAVLLEIKVLVQPFQLAFRIMNYIKMVRFSGEHLGLAFKVPISDKFLSCSISRISWVPEMPKFEREQRNHSIWNRIVDIHSFMTLDQIANRNRPTCLTTSWEEKNTQVPQKSPKCPEADVPTTCSSMEVAHFPKFALNHIMFFDPNVAAKRRAGAIVKSGAVVKNRLYSFQVQFYMDVTLMKPEWTWGLESVERLLDDWRLN